MLLHVVLGRNVILGGVCDDRWGGNEGWTRETLLMTAHKQLAHTQPFCHLVALDGDDDGIVIGF